MNYIKMSPYQESIWNLEQISSDSGISNIGGVIFFDRDIQPETFSAVLNHIILINGALRLRITANGKLYQTDDANLILEQFDFSDLSKEEFDIVIHNWISTPFKLYDSELYDVKFIRLRDSNAGFLKLHHIICDGMSMSLLCKQIENFYNLYVQNKKSDFVSPVVDNRFVDSLKNPYVFDDNKAREYFNISLPPTWLLKDDSKNFSAGSKKYTFSLAERTRLLDFCNIYNVSLISTLYACVCIYISKVKSTDKVCLGRVLMNRSSDNIDVLGMYVNTLPFFMDFSFIDNFSDICKIIDVQFREIYEFIDYPFKNIAGQFDNLLFDVAISHRIEKVIPKFDNFKIVEYFCGACDLNLRIDVQEGKDFLTLVFIYKTEAYSTDEIDLLFHRLMHILSQGINYTDITSMDFLCERDHALLKNLNSTDFTIDLDFYNCFKSQVMSKPQDVALIYGDRKFSYRYVDEKSDQIAFVLQQKGVLTDDIVGIMIERSELLPIIMLAVLKIGAAFLPISVDYPVARRISMAGICKITVTTKKYVIENCICLDDYKYLKGSVSLKKGKYAYLMYTSGTTGEPKAVMITMSSLVCRLFWMYDKYKLDGTVLQKTPNIFDVSVWELLLPLMFGGSICLMNHGDEKFPDAIAETIIKHQVSTVHFVPSMLSVFLEYVKDKYTFPTLKNVFASGEILHSASVRLFYKIFDDTHLYNLYGPTECTIDVTYYDCKKDDVMVPIGKPVYNTNIYIVNDKLDILPALVHGEILIVGDLVGSGYFGIDSDRFISFMGRRAYRTGDIGFLGLDGNIYFLGRDDSQIKLNGKRLDLTEIESKILEMDGIYNVKVILNQNLLIAYYTSDDVVSNDITIFLKDQLPAFMIPPLIIRIEQLPLTPTGKVDCAKLTSINLPVENYLQPSNELEALLKTEILAHLKLDDISVEYNLFDYGLDSLSIMQICVNLEKKGIPLSFSNFYTFPTIRQLASGIDQSEPTVFFRKNKNDALIIFFPYGGASAYVFYNLARLLRDDIDVCAVNMSFFNEYSEDEVISFLSSYINEMDYPNIYLYGHCVGSWLTIGLAPHLVGTKGIFISGSLPTTVGKKILGKIISPWDLMTDKMIKKYLNSINESKSDFTEEFFKQFRIDTGRFFHFMHNADKVTISVPVTLIFADDDKITKNYKSAYKNWNRYVDADFNVFVLENAKHDFISRKAQSLASIINDKLHT